METISSKKFRERNAKKHTKSGSANELTKAILRYLNLNSFFCWRNNTVGIWDEKKGIFRKNAGLNGIADIIGIEKKTGRFLAIEVKFGKDEMSYEQLAFMSEIERAGGIAIVARSIDDVIDGINKKQCETTDTSI
jgi:ketopantoate reductase